MEGATPRPPLGRLTAETEVLKQAQEERLAAALLTGALGSTKEEGLRKEPMVVLTAQEQLALLREHLP